MNRFFNIAGPIQDNQHYHLDPLTRLDWEEIQMLIEQNKYFVLHAPRQTGKTSTMLSMMDALNHGGEYVALYANVEATQAMGNDVDRGINNLCDSIAHNAWIHLKTELLIDWLAQKGQSISPGDKLTQLLSYWSLATDKPCVLFLDEVDALVGDTLISLLRQIRAGYIQRPSAFPQSIVLCGVRDVRDYRIHSSGEIITGGSAFNIKSESLRMGNFGQSEIRALYQQHTDATGQRLSADIFDQLWQDTKGQPWLVNALAHEMLFKAKENRDRNKTIELEDYRVAREKLIYSRATHLDQLSDKLKEPRVHAVIAPMLATENTINAGQSSLDDLQYVEDLGLIVLTPKQQISNRIYQEVIPRELTYPTQLSICHEQSWYLNDDNHIDMPKLLSAFQQFFRENAQAWIERFDYKEAGPQLLMQAFLQRIINGGGRINREYALGSKRTDLIIEWPTSDEGFYGDVQRIVIELKILYGALDTCIKESMIQTADYADRLGASQAHLMIFDRNANVSWDDKTWQRQANLGDREISIWGC
ncbi:MAG: hypothetical protein ACI8WB_006054 [Phenylobacterium sp.]|jgi:hypothetical protein